VIGHEGDRVARQPVLLDPSYQNDGPEARPFDQIGKRRRKTAAFPRAFVHQFVRSLTLRESAAAGRSGRSAAADNWCRWLLGALPGVRGAPDLAEWLSAAVCRFVAGMYRHFDANGNRYPVVPPSASMARSL
jgi:hypothetical protein